MRRSRLAVSGVGATAVALVIAGIAALLWSRPLDRWLSDARLVGGSPHERYSARLRLQRWLNRVPGVDAASRAAGITVFPQHDVNEWLLGADLALTRAAPMSPPFAATGTFTGAGDAVAWRFHGRRGHRIVVSGRFAGGPPFVDLYDATASAPRHLASAPSGAMEVSYDVRRDGDFVLRLQPSIGATGEYRIVERSEPSVTFPVRGLTPRAVQSRFGAERDEGRRSHEGIDIFAPRGTPVVAATDGWVGNSLENGLGGKVIWIGDPFGGLRTYYAHLDRHAATPGQRVRAGDIVGYVGNTGNARGGPTHLHFGIYAMGTGSVDPLPFVCGAMCDSSR